MEQIVNQGKILEIRNGSHLYGLNTPKSDEDFSGIFLAPLEYHIGLHKVEQVDLSIKSKLANGKNSPEAVDRTFYELKRFVNLAIDSNPNILEQLFVDEKNIVFINEAGRKLLDNRHLFLSQNAIRKFVGYATSQKRKLEVKKENLHILEAAKSFLELVQSHMLPSTTLPEIKDIPEFKQYFILRDKKADVYRVGEYNLNKNITIKEAIKKLNDILLNSSNRQEIIKQHGYDTKFASHLVRLLLEIIEILETGNLIFPLTKKDMLMEIKEGKWELNKVMNYVETLEEQLKYLREHPELMKVPVKSSVHAIEKLVIEIYKDFLMKEEK